MNLSGRFLTHTLVACLDMRGQPRSSSDSNPSPFLSIAIQAFCDNLHTYHETFSLLTGKDIWM